MQGSMIDHGQSFSPPEQEEPLKSTLREPSSNGMNYDDGTNNNVSDNICRKCGYPISSNMRECPMCHTPIGQNNQPNNRRDNPDRGQNQRDRFKPNVGGTINPWTTPTEDSFCTLKRIPWQNEQISYEPVSYCGQMVALNRANTDANNNSITSKVQAVLTHENGEWFIENQSELQTTLIRVNRKVKLEDGDVIVLGNRMFEFKKG